MLQIWKFSNIVNVLKKIVERRKALFLITLLVFWGPWLVYHQSNANVAKMKKLVIFISHRDTYIWEWILIILEYKVKAYFSLTTKTAKFIGMQFAQIAACLEFKGLLINWQDLYENHKNLTHIEISYRPYLFIKLQL
jgi:hypothetical protein